MARRKEEKILFINTFYFKYQHLIVDNWNLFKEREVKCIHIEEIHDAVIIN